MLINIVSKSSWDVFLDWIDGSKTMSNKYKRTTILNSIKNFSLEIWFVACNEGDLLLIVKEMRKVWRQTCKLRFIQELAPAFDVKVQYYRLNISFEVSTDITLIISIKRFINLLSQVTCSTSTSFKSSKSSFKWLKLKLNQSINFQEINRQIFIASHSKPLKIYSP